MATVENPTGTGSRRTDHCPENQPLLQMQGSTEKLDQKPAITLYLPHIILIITAFQLLMSPSYAAKSDEFKKGLFVLNGDTLPYRILFPAHYDPARRYPLVLVLHGSGERGSDNEKQLTHGSSLFLADSNRTDYPAIVVFPQCRKGGYWSNVYIENDTGKGKKRIFHFKPDSLPTREMAMLMAFADWLPGAYKIRKKESYVVGLSMGGMGTLEIIRRLPGRFKRAIAICGGAHPAAAAGMKKTKIWLTHGLKDNIVPAEFSIRMAEALKQQKVKVELTLFPEANHNAWDPTFQLPNLLPWLFGKTTLIH